MSGFLMTPMTRFYMEALQNRNNTAGGEINGAGTKNPVSGQTGSAGVGMTGRPNAGSFADAVHEQLARKDGASPDAAGMVTGRNEALVQAMSREEYKLYIYQKITGMPMHPSQRWDAVMVNISEEGFAAMQADPAYERWVLDTLRRDFAFDNPWSNYTGGSYWNHYFGATKEEYKSESRPMGLRKKKKRTNTSQKKEDGFWERRAKRHKLYMDLLQKAWYKHENEQKYRVAIDIQRKEVSSALLQQWAMEQITGEEQELGINPSVLSQAATDFAQGYIFFKIPSALVNPRPKTGK